MVSSLSTSVRTIGRMRAWNCASAFRTWILLKRSYASDAAKASLNHQAENVHEGGDKPVETNNVEQYDVAIVGGGMVGMALACTLASMPLTKSLSIAIIDSNPALGSRKHIPNDSIPDPRVSTVTPATLSHFKDIGAWEYIKKHSHAFFDKMQVWDYTGLGYTRYNAKDVGREILGCVVENKVLQSSLLSRLQDAGVGERIYPAKLTSMSLQSHFPSAVDMLDIETSNYSSRTSGDPKRHGCLAKLDLSDGNTLYTKLVVGADGAKSSVRKIAGLKTTGWNYSQHAVICTVKHATENHCAWQRFLPSGPIALLPIGDTYSNIVWTMTPHEASNHKSMHEDDFVKAINHALDYGYGPHPHSNLGFIDKFSWLAGGAISSTKESFEVPPKIDQLVSERMAFPLSLMHAHEYASHRVVLIGDAAHAVHPLAGQGVNLGFGDAICLSNIIAEGILVGSDIGELSLLKKYEKERKMANLTMMAILDGFQKAFSVDLGPINLLRAAAFHGAQYIGPLKRNIISYATGEQKWPLFG